MLNFPAKYRLQFFKKKEKMHDSLSFFLVRRQPTLFCAGVGRHFPGKLNLGSALFHRGPAWGLLRCHQSVDVCWMKDRMDEWTRFSNNAMNGISRIKHLPRTRFYVFLCSFFQPLGNVLWLPVWFRNKPYVYAIKMHVHIYMWYIYIHIIYLYVCIGISQCWTCTVAASCHCMKPGHYMWLWLPGVCVWWGGWRRRSWEIKK